MLYNFKYRLWNIIRMWWDRKKPTCKHWYRLFSSAAKGRREIEVYQCFWCGQYTSDIRVKGKPFDEYHNQLQGYGEVEMHPITEDPPIEPMRNDRTIKLPFGGDRYYERRSNVVVSDRDGRESKKAKGKSRQSSKSTLRLALRQRTKAVSDNRPVRSRSKPKALRRS